LKGFKIYSTISCGIKRKLIYEHVDRQSVLGTNFEFGACFYLYENKDEDGHQIIGGRNGMITRHGHEVHDGCRTPEDALELVSGSFVH